LELNLKLGKGTFVTSVHGLNGRQWLQLMDD